MRTTWLSRIACRLGFHLLVWGQRDYDDRSMSLVGGCVRCGEPTQWDT